MGKTMTYVISDIHGEYKKLRTLLNILEDDAIEYIFLGDYLDKGENPKATINLLLNLSCRKKCIFLAGDHEYAWMEYIKGDESFLKFILNYGGIKTLESYSNRQLTVKEANNILSNKTVLKKLLKNHLPFYSGLKFYHTIDSRFLCVHAGINPENKSLKLDEHNKKEIVFIRDKFINSGFLYKGRRIIFGHTAFKEPYLDKYKIGIDTGAVYAEMGTLTAFNIEKELFIKHTGKKWSLSK